MKNKINVIVLLLIINGINFTSCRKLIREPDDELSIQRQTYNGNNLKLDGFYYCEIENYQGKMYNRCMFYRNGVLRNLGGGEQLDGTFLSGNHKDDWGVFLIVNNEIKFDKWYRATGGAYQSIVRSGTILNDTTFHITESYRMKNGNKTEWDNEDKVYHFKKYSPKPDSLNSYIK